MMQGEVITLLFYDCDPTAAHRPNKKWKWDIAKISLSAFDCPMQRIYDKDIVMRGGKVKVAHYLG